MDLIALGFYACVCGVLSVFAARLDTFPARLGIGAVVGAGAAIALPMLRGMMGGY